MNRGAILFNPGFVFRDGGLSDKLLVVLNHADEDDPLLLAKTTSRQKTRKKNPGCDHLRYAFFVPEKRKHFDDDTWIILDFPYAVPQAEMLEKVSSNAVKLIGTLPDQMMNEIRNCALKSDDFPLRWAALLQKKGPSCAKVCAAPTASPPVRVIRKK